MGNTEAEVVAELAAKATEPVLQGLSRGTMIETDVLLVPGNMRTESIKKYLDEYLIAPERKAGTACLVELQSLIDHVNRHKDSNTVLFAHPGDSEADKAPSITAVFDYNESGPEGAPRFGKHRALYEFPLSEQWTVWQEAGEKTFNQQEFAEFIEERITDIVDPATAGEKVREFAEDSGFNLANPATLMNLSRNLSVRVGQKVTNNFNPQSGETQLNFETTHSDQMGGPLKVPGAFILRIPVFRNGSLYEPLVRLRYRVHGGTVLWNFALHRTDIIFDHAFGEACEKTATDTDLQLFKGSPEA